MYKRQNIGGAESYVALVARSLKSLGYNVFIASAGGALAVELQKEGIKHFFLPIRLSKFISGLLLKRIVEKYNIDLIHANSEAAGIVAVKTRNKYKLDIPIVYTAPYLISLPHTLGCRKAYLRAFFIFLGILLFSMIRKAIGCTL